MSNKHLLSVWLALLPFLAGIILADDLQCWIPGQCVNSELIQSGIENDRAECHKKCMNNDDCNWFTFNSQQTYCQLFANCLNITETFCEACITSEKDCGVYQCGISGSCQGQVDHQEEASSESQCQEACLSDPQCSWYTFDAAANLCLLFESCPTIDEDCSSCVSGERGCGSDPASSMKLLVTTGYTLGGPTYVTEIVDLENPDAVCDDLAPFPENTSYWTAGVGGLLNDDKIFVCGDQNCYFLGNDTSINATTFLNFRKYDTAATTPNRDGLWVTGGSSIKSIEVVVPGQNTTYGPELPNVMDSHCFIQLDQETYMLLGGRAPSGGDAFSTDRTFFYHVGNGTFTPGPTLTRAKSDIMCGVIDILDGSSKLVLVAGGYADSGGDGLDEVETWTLDLESGMDSFTRLGNVTLPEKVSATGSVVSANGKSLIIVGGFVYNGNPSEQGNLITISCSSPESCQAETMEQKLRVPRWQAVAMLVPDYLVNCN